MNIASPSFICPGCSTSLIETIAGCGFLLGSHCPYCGMIIRWSRPALGMIVLGLIGAGSGIFLLLNIAHAAEKWPLPISVLIGLSLAIFLLGVATTRFEQTSLKDDPGLSSPRMDFPYM
ncbi:MAG TPA: hypothetical protein PLP17_13200 [Oligoflexia bacterium]|nr:hypothetical protein [Oligoflexia bacterium]